MTAIDSTKAELDMAAPNLRRPWGTWALGALILFLAVTPFILVIVISFGQKIEGLAGNGISPLPITGGFSSARCGRTR